MSHADLLTPPVAPRKPAAATRAAGGLWAWQSRFAPYLFVSPFILLFLAFMLYPFARSLTMSFHRSAGPRHHEFVGFDNYLFLLSDPLFWKAVQNTVLYACAFLLIQIPAALGLAILLNQSLLRGRSFFRFAFFSSNLVGQVFVAGIFFMLMNPRDGLINQALSLLWPGTVQVHWLTDPRFALAAVLIANLWLSIGYGMIYFLAALQSIERDLYEAAEVDGAGAWSRFWYVTAPGIRPVMTFMILIGTIAALQLFELPYVLLQGPGPNYSGLTIVMYLFMAGFEDGNLGYGAAIGWMLVALILTATFLLARLRREAQ